MKERNLYGYEREDGVVVTTPFEPETDEETQFAPPWRLDADEGKILYRGEEGSEDYQEAFVIDTMNKDEWKEKDYVEKGDDYVQRELR